MTRFRPKSLNFLLILFILLHHVQFNLSQRASDGEEPLEMERHGTGTGGGLGHHDDFEEGSGNSFNPDDEDDIGVSEQSFMPKRGAMNRGRHSEKEIHIP